MMGIVYKLTCTNEACKYCATMHEGGGMYYFDVVQKIEEEVLTEERNAPEEIVELLKSGHHLNSVTSFLCPVCREFRSNSSFVIREKLLDSLTKTAVEYKMHYLDGKPKCPKCDSELIYIENLKSPETKCPKCGHPSMQIKRIGSFD